MSLSDLSKGILKDIMFNEQQSANPCLQVVQIREMKNKGTTARYRAAISDGQYWVSAVCGTVVNGAVTEGKIRQYSIIKLTNYAVNQANGKKVLVILGCDVVKADVDDIIGSPEDINVSEPPAAPPPDARPPPKQMPDVRPAAQPSAPRGATPKPPPANVRYLPISSLNLYLAGQWTVRAKVVQKSQMKTWNNARGSGNLFSIVLKDIDGSEIRGTFFKADADNWYNKIEVDKVYSVSGGRIKMADQKFNSVKSEYEITFDGTTRFVELDEADDRFGGLTYHFVSLEDLENTKENSTVDIVAIVKMMEPVQDVTTKKGAMSRRRVQLVDKSQKMTELTMWGEEAEKFPDSAQDHVITVKDARVGEYQGRKQLSLLQSSILKIAPNDPEAVALQSWYDSEGSHMEFHAGFGGSSEFTTRMLYLKAVDDQGLGQSTEKADWFTFYGMATKLNLERPVYYLACPNPDCRGKKVDEHEGEYICQKCQKQITEPLYRYNFSVVVADFTGRTYISVFGDEEGKTIFGCSAAEWAQLTDGKTPEEKARLIADRQFCAYKIKCSVKLDTFRQPARQKFTARTITPIDYAEAAKFFEAEIEKY